MKKTLSLVALLFVTNLAISQSKVGFVKSQTLIDTMPSAKKGYSLIVEKQKQLEIELQEKMDAFEKDRIFLEKSKSNLSPTQLTSRETKLNSDYNNIQQFQQNMQVEIQSDYQTLQDTITARIKLAVRKVADRKKLDQVFEITNILYFNENYEITKEVIPELLHLEAILENKK
jgi:outer membrane protein